MLSIIAPGSGKVLTLKKETSTIIFDTVVPIKLKIFKIKLHWFYPGVGRLYRVNCKDSVMTSTSYLSRHASNGIEFKADKICKLCEAYVSGRVCVCVRTHARTCVCVCFLLA